MFRVVLLRLYPDENGVLRFLILCFAMVATVAIAAASWKWFEKPFVKRGHRHGYAPPLPDERERRARESDARGSHLSATGRVPAPTSAEE